MNLKDMVKDGKTASFSHFKHNELWYVTECGFEFPIHISDTDGAEFKNSDRAIFFMRWIRKHINLIKKAQTE